MPKQCPVCQQPLDAIERWGVQMDVCSKCRGVWLEQGELEQIIGFVRASMAQGEAVMPMQQSNRHHEHDDYDDDDRRVEYDEHGKPRRKRRFEIGDLFDIFG